MEFKKTLNNNRKKNPNADRISVSEEAFCQGVVAGKLQLQSWLDAGYVGSNRNIAASRASELRKKPKIELRIAQIRNEIAAAKAKPAEELLREIEMMKPAPGVPEIEGLGKALTESQREFVDKAGTQSQDMREMIGDVLTRVGRAKALAVRRMRLLEVVAARAVHPEVLAAPGGQTGLVTITWKTIAGEKVMQSEVDTGTLKELRDMEQQIARELGQWVERADETVTIKGLEDLDDAALARVMEQAEEIMKRDGITLPKVGPDTYGVSGPVQ